ncbi:MAG TPA: DUF3147 family protein [archaeon]|nr:DUF3147 family protein [archaeon]
MKTRVWNKVIIDFLLGGFLVALAVYIGISVGAVFGGMIAALPIRLGVTILLSYSESEAFTKQMIEGSLLTYIGTLFFLLTLYFGYPKFGLIKSFAAAMVVAFITIIIVFKLAGKI